MKLIFKINKPLDTVFEYLSNMQKFASVHPIISKIDSLTENNYLVYETLKIGLIPFSFTYPVTIEYNFNTKNITFKAVVMKLTKIEMNFILNTENNATIINENITIKSPLPIKSIMQNVFRKQHTILFKNIENLKLN